MLTYKDPINTRFIWDYCSKTASKAIFHPLTRLWKSVESIFLKGVLLLSSFRYFMHPMLQCSFWRNNIFLQSFCLTYSGINATRIDEMLWICPQTCSVGFPEKISEHLQRQRMSSRCMKGRQKTSKEGSLINCETLTAWTMSYEDSASGTSIQEIRELSSFEHFEENYKK